MENVFSRTFFKEKISGLLTFQEKCLLLARLLFSKKVLVPSYPPSSGPCPNCAVAKLAIAETANGRRRNVSDPAGHPIDFVPYHLLIFYTY
jgi:hypothetical protein